MVTDVTRLQRLSAPARAILAEIEQNGGTIVLHGDDLSPELVSTLQELRNAGYLRSVRAFEMVTPR